MKRKTTRIDILKGFLNTGWEIGKEKRGITVL